MSLNNITPLLHSKSQNKYDINNVELSLTNSIENSDFILLKNGTIKRKRKKNSYFEGYLDNKRLNKAIENSNKKRNKSFSNGRNKTNLFYKTNFDNLKHSIHSDTNIFNKAQKINIFENVIINNIDNNSLKLSYSYNNENSKNIGNKICNLKKEKCSYNEMMNIKRKKLDKYENLIKTKNMYRDLYKNLKRKNMKKNIKNKNSSKKKKSPNKLDYTFKEKELKEKMKYDNNILTITKNDIVEYNPLIENKKLRNQSEKNKNIKLNLNNLIVFKKQKEYKHYDYLGNNYTYYERNESSERKRIKNGDKNEYINIINKIRNEANKSNTRNKYNFNYVYTS